MVDGDKALVIQDKTLVAVAEREMEGIVPLFYDMAKAEATQITPDKMYESLTSAYKANIGIISNDITKIWNSENPNINAVKWLTALNNYVIDFAKTLYLPEPPKEADLIIKSFTRNKVPHFFIYAKDKEKHQVEALNDSTVNKLFNIIPNKPIQFNYIAGKLKYRHLMRDSKTEINKEIIDIFFEFEMKKRMSAATTNYSYNSEGFKALHIEFRKYIEDNYEIIYFVDVLVSYYYKHKNNTSKDALWELFGDIIYENLVINIGHTIQCECCNKRVESDSENAKYCSECAREINIQKTIKNRSKNKILFEVENDNYSTATRV